MTARGPKELRLEAVNPANQQSNALLTAAPLNVSQTVIIPVDGMDKMVLEIIFSRNTATQIQITPTVSIDGVNYGAYISTSIAVVGSVAQGTNLPYEDLFPVNANAVLYPTYPCNTFNWMKFVFTATTGSTTDLITVYSLTGVGPSI